MCMCGGLYCNNLESGGNLFPSMCICPSVDGALLSRAKHDEERFNQMHFFFGEPK